MKRAIPPVRIRLVPLRPERAAAFARALEILARLGAAARARRAAAQAQAA